MPRTSKTTDAFPKVWLGEVVDPNHFNKRFKLVAALDDGKWVHEPDLAKKYFNQTVLQVVPAAREQVQGRGCWTFEVRKKAGNPPGFDVHDPRRALPLVDLRDKSLDEARRLLFQVGVRRPEYGSRTSVVLLQGDQYCLLHFEEGESQGQWKARHPDGLVEIRRTDSRWSESDKLDGWQYFPANAEPDGQIVEHIDWRPDEDFISKVLQKYREAVEPWSGLKNSGADASAKAVARLLTEAASLADGAAQMEHFATRLKASWPQLSTSLDAVQEIGRLILESQEGRQARDTAIDAYRQQLAEDIRQREQARIEEDLKGARAEVERHRQAAKNAAKESERLSAKVKEQEAASDRLTEDEIAAKKRLEQFERDEESYKQRLREASAKLESIEDSREKATSATVAAKGELDEITRSLDEFAQKVEVEFAVAGFSPDLRLAALAARLQSVIDKSGRKPVALLPNPSPPWWNCDRAGDPRVIKTSGLRQRLNEESKAHGLVADDLILMDVLVRSGELVVVTGRDADLAIEAYARSVAGGQIRNHTLDPSTIGVDDFWRSPSTHASTSFAHAWHIASQYADRFVLLCLRSIDASSAELWMPPLATFLADDRRPRNLLVIATAPGCADPLREADMQSTELRHHVVGFRPRMQPGASTCQAALGGALPEITSLQPTLPEQGPLDLDAVAGIADQQVHPSITKRVVRVLRVASDSIHPDAAGFAVKWAGYLSSGEPNGLPAPIVDGYADLSKLKTHT